MSTLILEPIGIYHSDKKNPYEAARQSREDSNHQGEILLREGHNFEQALHGLDGVERIWLIFQFHLNENWKPMVMPPRGRSEKIGLFATRSPYRPNPLGLSCVRLLKISGRQLIVVGADLLDGTPILDIKPYLAKSDAFPGSKVPWLEGVEDSAWTVLWSTLAEIQLRWLTEHGVTEIRDFAEQQLQYEPFDSDRKRIEKCSAENFHPTADDRWVLAYRTWRLNLQADIRRRKIEIKNLTSGYSDADLADPTDKWQDKDLHRQFRQHAF